MRVILALDQGTSSSRAAVFDRKGGMLGFAQCEISQHFPQPGWVEHDPQEIWESQLQTAVQALRAAGASASDVAAIGITNQRETTLLWERGSGNPVANAVVWQDRRTAAACEALQSRGAGERVAAQTGLVLDPYFSATKLAWLLDNIPGARANAQRGDLAFGTVDSWLVWKLTGGARHVTDVTNASRTMLFDVHRLEWSDDLLREFNVPAAVLPQVLPCTASFGTAAPQLFGCAIPICAVCGDQQAALIGQAGFARGLAKNTYGTGSFLMLNTGTAPVRSTHGLLTTIAYAFEPQQATYALEGSVFATGAAIQWLRDGLHIIERAADVEELARQVSDTGGVYFVPAFTGLGAPYWDPLARGIIAGITRGTTRAHIARAALESIAFQSAEVIGAMERDADLQLAELRVDGGGSASELCMQLQADLIAAPVVRARIMQTTALGAAYLAGLQSGYWRDLDEVGRQWEQDARFVPAMPDAQRSTEMERWRRAVALARGWSG